jgi:hypothetical protein
MSISESEVVEFLQSIQSQQNIQNKSWVRLKDITNDGKGPDDVGSLQVYCGKEGIDKYISTHVKTEVALTKAGKKAAQQGDVSLGASGMGAQKTGNPFSKSWLNDGVEIPVNTAVFSGNYPFQRRTLKSYLRDQFGVRVHDLGGPADNPDLLVLGKQNHSEGAVERFLKDQQGTTLRICSHEMLLSWLYTGIDPNVHPESLPPFFERHPPLQRVREILMGKWPKPGKTLAGVKPGGDGKSFDTEVEKGPLRRMGYSVGKTGETKADREEILEVVFSSPLEDFPGTYPIGYLDGWGHARSGKRLKKIARSIASFCQNAKKRSNPPDQAIRDWQEDLRWMKRELYHPLNFGFDWPTP